jgi:SAM-dependent methyltransferase
MVGLQAREHDLVTTSGFRTEEEYVLHLMHRRSYLEAARLVASGRVLDLGCNVGYGTRILAATAGAVVGVDVSEKAIATARAGPHDERVTFQVVDGSRLPFPSAEYDAVVSFQVIEHIVDCAGYLGELRRVLRPAGLAVLTTPNAPFRLDPGMPPWNAFHVHEYDSGELASVLRGVFPHVAVYGMLANEPLRSVELRRVSAEKQRARGARETALARRLIRRLVPRSLHPIAARLRSALAGRPPEVARHEASPSFDRYRVEDLRYAADGLDGALDLFAICCDAEEPLRQARARLG